MIIQQSSRKRCMFWLAKLLKWQKLLLFLIVHLHLKLNILKVFESPSAHSGAALRRYSRWCASLKVDLRKHKMFWESRFFSGYLFTSRATLRYWIPNCAQWLFPQSSPLTNQPFTTTILLNFLFVWDFSNIKIRLWLGATWEKLNFKFSWKSFCCSANCSRKCFTIKAASCPLKRLMTLHFKHKEDVLSSLLTSPRLLQRYRHSANKSQSDRTLAGRMSESPQVVLANK